MSMKILSPAGDFESLKMAVFNGADEVYLGVKDFNARNIEGFNLQTLKQAVDFAHIYGVRVFLTVNILFSNEEIQSALDLVVEAYNLGVDAFIVQDIGLIDLISKHFPQIEIHASTQMGIHNLEGVKFVEQFGVKRVVLARETSLEEIKRIKQNSNVEIEYFVHGALCVSFSGNCYISSYLHNASGNRGKCKQLCRLPYEFYSDNKKIVEGYLLSAKDFNMLNRLQDLQNAGVDSLKIEGRARRPYYVGAVTKAYRDKLNNLKVQDSDINLAFNRGFTEGYFNGNDNIISKIQNHIGVEVGKVTKVKLGKRFNEIYISSSVELSSKSSFKFFNKDKEVATISAYDLVKVGKEYKITTTSVVEVGNTVNLISDYNKETEMLNTTFKIVVNIEVTAKENQTLKAVVSLNNQKVELTGEICERAKNQPLSVKDFETCFNKNEYFMPNLICNIDNVFITKQKLNEFRRKVYEKVQNLLTCVDKPKLEKLQLKLEQPKVKEFADFQFVETLNEDFKSVNIIYSPEEYVLNDIKCFIELCKEQNKKPFLDLPNFATKQDVELLKNILEETNITVIANNLYALGFNAKKIIGGGLNVYNSYTANFFNLPYISAERGYFKMPYMTMRHCPIKQHTGCNCANCKFSNGYFYKMQSGKFLKLKRKKLSTCTFYLTD